MEALAIFKLVRFLNQLDLKEILKDSKKKIHIQITESQRKLQNSEGQTQSERNKSNTL
jgi:hypothetical protein